MTEVNAARLATADSEHRRTLLLGEQDRLTTAMRQASAGPNAAAAKPPPRPEAPSQPQRVPPATRKDLVEMNKHLVNMMGTVHRGLSDEAGRRAEEQRAAIDARLVEITRSVNTMEGLMRIELVPQFRMLLDDAVATLRPGHARRSRALMLNALCLAIGLVAGAVFSDRIGTLAAHALPGTPVAFETSGTAPPQMGAAEARAIE